MLKFLIKNLTFKISCSNIINVVTYLQISQKRGLVWILQQFLAGNLIKM
jgi:hypothetical protein